MKSKLLSKRVLVLFILLLGFSPLSQAFAQFGITGTVTDWARNPITGTTTDFDGHYTIYAIPGDTLIFSYLGMKTLKVGVRSFGSVINVVLQDDSFNFEISQNDPVINEPTIEYKAICPWHTRLYYIEKSPRIRVTPSNKSLNLRIV